MLATFKKQLVIVAAVEANDLEAMKSETLML